MRIISIESDRQRLGLSLTEVTAAEKAQWEERQLELVAAAAAEAARQEAEQAAQAELNEPAPQAGDGEADEAAGDRACRERIIWCTLVALLSRRGIHYIC